MNKYREMNRFQILALILLMLTFTGCLGSKPQAPAAPAATATVIQQATSESEGAQVFPTPISDTNTPPAEGIEASPTSVPVEETNTSNELPPTETPSAPSPTDTAVVVPTSAATPALAEDVYEPIPGCARSRLHWGDIIRIVPEIEYVRIRSTADTSPSDNIVRKWYRSELAQITGLPRCNYGWIIWPIRTADNTKGWVPESNGTTFWVMKVRGFFPTEVPPSR
jgi:hypothetical protein